MTNQVKDQKQSQSQRFIDKTRELGCDEDDKAFDDKLRRIAKAKPAEKAKTKKPAK